MERNRNLTSLVIGIILIALGVLTMFGRLFDIVDWEDLWPLGLVGIGCVFFIAMAFAGKGAGGLAVPGSILVTVGLILIYMENTNNWEAWSYAWALIIAGVGVGVLINGYWSDQPDMRKNGLKTIRDGVILFLTFGVIMEFIFSVTGVSEFGNMLLWSILLAVVGVVLLITRLLRMGKPEGERVDLFWPVLMIGIGVLASLAYLDQVPTENLWALVNLWPLLLIVAGVGLLFRNRSPLIGALLGVLVVAILFGVAFTAGQLGLKTEPAWFFENGTFNFGEVTGEQVTGSGDLITETRPVSGFDRVEMSIPGNLEIEQGGTESLTVTGDDNLLPLLVTSVSGDKLTIRYKSNINARPSQPIQITLTVKDLEGLEMSSPGRATTGPIQTDDFRLGLSSSGDIVIEELQADKLTARLSSSGDIIIQGGTANELDLTVSSSGSFQAKDLEVQKAEIEVTSSGDVTVWVVDDLDVQITSSGDVYYYGSPSVHERLTSSGDLIGRGEK